MAKFKKSDFRPARERIDALPKARRARIEEGASKILLAMHLSELRKALDVTQAKLAHRTGLTQAEVSRIENNPETVQIRTMERYVRGMGGKIKIVADFPDGGPRGNTASQRQTGQIEGHG
jgi:DNA-binding XRE family transcriptional regulator